MKYAPFVCALLTTLLCADQASATSLPPIREIVAFGDSLSDCGAFGYVPTTKPAQPWDQQLAHHFGYELRPNWTGNLPGLTHGVATRSDPAALCYAQSGARVAQSAGHPPIPGTAQLNRYLAEHKQFTADQLVTVYLGTADVLDAFLNQASASSTADAAYNEEAAVRLAATQLVVLVDRMLDHGAQRIAVLNLYDLGKSSYDNPSLTDLTNQFNTTLATLLPRDSRVIRVDTFGFFNGLAANPRAYGFRHPMDDNACRDPSLFDLRCYTDPSLWKSPDADKTYMLIGMVHFTGRTEALLARYVLQQVDSSASTTAPLP